MPMPKLGKNVILAIVLVALAVGLAACGGSSGTTGSSAASSEATQTTTESTETTTPPPASSGPPLAVALAIDNTMRAGPNANEVKQSLAEFAEDTAILISSTIERGGSFKASIFGGPGTAITFDPIELDPKGTPEQRYHEATKHYAPIAITVDQAVGQMPLSGTTGKRLTALPPGTAVGEALRKAVQAVRGKPGERWAVIATDGFDTTQGELPLPNVQQTAKVLRRTVGNLDAHGVGIAMVGVGLTPHHNSWHQDGPLTKAWAIVCHEIHARECQVHADPRLPPPLEGTAQAILEGV
jgi:hypothetical protein